MTTSTNAPAGDAPTILEGPDAAVIAHLAAQVQTGRVISVQDDAERDRKGYLVGVATDGSAEILDTIDWESYADHPYRKTGTVQLHTPGALVGYASRHVDELASTLWADVPTGTLTVILDDHEQSGAFAGWAQHRAACKVTRDPDWAAWRALHDAELVTQDRFAEFLQEYSVCVVEPDGATLLEVARTMQVTSGSKFRRALNQHSGEVQLTYEEDVAAKAGATGQSVVPREFNLSLPIFEGGDRAEVKGEFRYRLRSGELRVGVKLHRIEEVERLAFGQLASIVAEGLSLTPIDGSAPQPRS